MLAGVVRGINLLKLNLLFRASVTRKVGAGRTRSDREETCQEQWNVRNIELCIM